MFEVLPAVLALLAVTFPGPAEGGKPNRSAMRVKPTAHELLHAPTRAVRATAVDAQDLLARGIARSQTFGRLMAALDGTDVIVYVEVTRSLPAAVAGRLLFATTVADGHRYLRVQISADGPLSMRIAALGHELQHAIEVSEAPEVRCEQSLARFYERIGTEGAVPRSYDTTAAQIAGQQVLLEVKG
jgi:hypothetical protein